MSNQQASNGRRVAFRVPQHYTVNQWMGEGAYGVVCSAIHAPTGVEVAIKKVAKLDKRMLCLRTLRELRLLRQFDHENIIRILDVPAPASRERLTEVYLVQELMPTDLHRVIQSESLSDDHCKYFIYQLLRGLKYIHSAGVLHRDLKPANLLVNAQCDLKICDFGLARADMSNGEQPSFMTEYVATRWYRAPEIMLTLKRYTKAIDIWSAGCILAEMRSRRPLFPGKDYHDQLVRIFRVLGTPTPEECLAIKSHRSRQYIQSMQWHRKTPWDAILPFTSAHCQDLLDRLLIFDPERRITAADAIKHPYVLEYHSPEDEPDSELAGPELLSFDRCLEDLSTQELKCKSRCHKVEKDTLLTIPDLLFDEVMGPRATNEQNQNSLVSSYPPPVVLNGVLQSSQDTAYWTDATGVV